MSDYDHWVPVEDRIPYAAKWLDENYPGWAEKIDRARFNMSDPNACIGPYLDIDWLKLSKKFEDDTHIDRIGVFASCTHEWLAEIEKRVNA